MKILGLLSIALMSISSLYGQENWCGSDQHLTNSFSSSESRQGYYTGIVNNAQNFEAIDNRGVNGTIPVVVHVIHNGGEGNISYDQILDAIEVLNEDYQKLNADTSDVRNTTDAPFADVAANVGLSFELAKLDPNGNCTNGVERIYSPGQTFDASDDCKAAANGGADPWPYDQYLNIWVVNSIESDGGAGTTLGYAVFPYDVPPFLVVDPLTHGIVIRHDSFGRIGTSNSDGETLTHEVGHILGLWHTFESSINEFYGGVVDPGNPGCHTDDCATYGDQVCDTPPVGNSTWGCNPSQNTCTQIPSGDYFGIDAFDQYENWMSYDICQSMFSEGQKDKILLNMSDIAFLANWISLENNTATGVGLPAVLCAANFYSNTTQICAGNTVEFFDDSYFNVTGTDWTFEGGTPATSTDSDPVITYNTPGIYSVTLDVTDGTNTETTTVTNYILVLGNPGDPAPYSEGFQTMTDVTDNQRFSVVNDNGAEEWEHHPTVGIQYSKSIWLENFGNTDESFDDIISGTIDLSDIDPSDPLVFTFQYAYKKVESGNNDRLRFYVSNDCGETWALRKSLQGNALSSDIQTTPFIEPVDSDWTLITVTNINSAYYSADFRYKFEFKNDGGNNIYIDDINLWSESMVDVIDTEGSYGLSVYPNPTKDNITIELFAQQGEQYDIGIFNALGQKIESVYQGELNGGLNQLEYSTANLPKGVYYVRVTSEGRIETMKLIKE